MAEKVISRTGFVYGVKSYTDTEIPALAAWATERRVHVAGPTHHTIKQKHDPLGPLPPGGAPTLGSLWRLTR